MSALGKIVAALVILFLAIAGYEFFVKGGGNQGNLTKGATGIVTESFDTGAAEGGDNQEFLRVLKNLQSVSLDGSILSSDAFSSLVDFSVTLSDQPQGRANPFKPINPSEPNLVAAGVNASSTSH